MLSQRDQIFGGEIIVQENEEQSPPYFIRGRPISVRLIVPAGQIERPPTGKSDNRKSEKSVVR